LITPHFRRPTETPPRILSGRLMHLGQNPEVESAATAEVDQVLGGRTLP